MHFLALLQLLSLASELPQTFDGQQFQRMPGAQQIVAPGFRAAGAVYNGTQPYGGMPPVAYNGPIVFGGSGEPMYIAPSSNLFNRYDHALGTGID